MVRWRSTASFVLFLASVAPSQVLRWELKLNGITYKEMKRRIFEGENDTIKLLSHSHLNTEVYLQSLGYSDAKDMYKDLDPSQEYVIADKYFLAKVELDHLDHQEPTEKHLFARSAISRYIKTNHFEMEQLHPSAQLAMFFVDLTSFDPDNYTLTYKGTEIDTDYIVFSVAPNTRSDSRRFWGQIWVQPSSCKIVHIRGVFTGPSESWFRHFYDTQWNFHFDSFREQVSDGVWLPTVAYFEEIYKWHDDGDLFQHFRGYTLLWQHHGESSGGRISDQNVDSHTPAGADAGSKAPLQNDVISRLEEDGLLATPGPVEESLDAVARQIAASSRVPLSRIECRVLLTAPAEIFSVGNVIVVSRGLLNIIPDDSTFAVLVARQIAHLALDHSEVPRRTFRKSIFELNGKKDFAGLGFLRTPAQEAAADEEAITLLNQSPYREAIEPARVFLSHLEIESRRFPNLLRARFGPAIVPVGSSFARPQRTDALPNPNTSLLFRNRYGVSWNGELLRLERPSQSQTLGSSRPLTSPVSGVSDAVAGRYPASVSSGELHPIQ
jgi:hypothetical protein